MNADFKITKQKISQQDLRKCMAEQKKNRRINGEGINSIHSPFVKCDDNHLMCQLCKKKLNHSVWKVHINSKKHKANSEQLKKLLENHTYTRTINNISINEKKLNGTTSVFPKSFSITPRAYSSSSMKYGQRPDTQTNFSQGNEA